MRRLRVIAIAFGVVLVAAAVAFAAQTNTYTVEGSMSPSKSGTTKKPVPVSVNFNYTVGEQTNQRPLPVKQFAIGFDGLRTNGGKFAKCTFAQTNTSRGDTKCSSGSLVGTGKIEALVGAPSDPSYKSTKCALDLKVYNGGQSKAVLFIRGGPPTCPTAQAQPIDASYITTSKGTTLRFVVPGPLLHQLGLDIAVTHVESKIKKLTKKSKGKTYGYYESIGGCKGKRRNITVKFTTEDNVSKQAQKVLSCS